MKKRFTFLILLVVSIIMSTMVIYADTSNDYDESVYAKHKPILKIDESSFPNEMVRRAVLKRYDMNRDGYLSQYEMEDPTSFSVDAADIQETDGYKYGRQVYQDEKYIVIDFKVIEVFKNVSHIHFACALVNGERGYVKNFKYLSTLKIDSIGITFSDRNYNLNQLKGLKYISFVACENFNLKFDKKSKVESISLLVPFKTEQEGLDAVPEIIKAKVSPTAIEFFERNTILFAEEFLGKKFPDTKSDSYILLTFEGKNKEELKYNYQVAADICLEKLGATDVFIVDTEERKESVWKARGAFLEAIKASTTQMDECDVVVPRSEIANYIKFTYELAKTYQIRIPSFGHAGDGNLHIYICKDNYSDEVFAEKLNDIFNDMYQKAKEVGGLVSGEHGIGFAKKVYMKELLGTNQVKLMQGIKDVFDPHHILNPGKIID